MEIKEKNIIAAYNKADSTLRQALRTMFPDIDFERKEQAEKRPVTERVKTFEDACRELGNDHPFVEAWHQVCDLIEDSDHDLTAYLKLRIVCAALNEGWEPQFTEGEWRWYPWYWLYTEDELESKSDEWKRSNALIETGDLYNTGFAGLAYSYSNDVPSSTNANIGSRLCLKSETLARYCGTQFASLWADYCLIRK